MSSVIKIYALLALTVSTRATPLQILEGNAEPTNSPPHPKLTTTHPPDTPPRELAARTIFRESPPGFTRPVFSTIPPTPTITPTTVPTTGTPTFLPIHVFTTFPIASDTPSFTTILSTMPSHGIKF